MRNVLPLNGHCSRSQGKRFPDFYAAKPAVDHLMEKTKDIGKIDPEPTIQTSGIEASIHKGVMPLDHHEPFALHTIHGRDRNPFTSSYS